MHCCGIYWGGSCAPQDTLLIRTACYECLKDKTSSEYLMVLQRRICLTSHLTSIDNGFRRFSKSKQNNKSIKLELGVRGKHPIQQKMVTVSMFCFDSPGPAVTVIPRDSQGVGPVQSWPTRPRIRVFFSACLPPPIRAFWRDQIIPTLGFQVPDLEAKAQLADS